MEYSNGKNPTFVNSLQGVPQGGILSPLLSNLILHELDQHVDNIQKEKELDNKGRKPYITNPKYHAMTMRIHRLTKKIDTTRSPDPRATLVTKLKTLKRERRRMKSIIPNESVTRIKYVRYADD